MSIAIKSSNANRIRALAQAHPYLTADDIVRLAGFGRGAVVAALRSDGRMGGRRQPKAAK